MKWNQKGGGSGGSGAGDFEPSAAQLSAFGKHPGWDDHIPGIGVDSELLARIKQVFYVAGIGAQVDSGAWEKLDAAKRAAGFDHQFLGIFGGRIVLGCLWSSVDRLGRAKYPMVLCLEVSRLSPASAYAIGWPVLEELQRKCQATRSSGEVSDACAESLLQLREAYTGALGTAPRRETDSATRTAFLSAPELGPERGGYLRVFHELGLAESAGTGGKAEEVPARVSRVPAPSLPGAVPIILWAELLLAAVTDARPLWLIQRRNVDWLDVIVGAPEGREFFCLQASPAAVPLATSVPYDLPPEARLHWAAVEKRYLAATPQAEPSTWAPSASAKPAGSPRIMLIGGAVLVLVVVVILGLMLAHQGKPSGSATPPSAPGTTPTTVAVKPPPVPEVKPPPAPPAALPQDAQYDAAMKAARAALDRGDYDGSLSQAQIALQARANDSEAAKIVQQANELKKAGETAAKFKATLAAAQVALSASQWNEAETQATAGLRMHVNDEEANLLLGRIKEQHGNWDYSNAISSAQSALAGGKLDEAVSWARGALLLRASDPAATGIIDRVQELKNAAGLDAKYQAALAAAGAALQAGDLDAARKQVSAALDAKPGDDAASKLQKRIGGADGFKTAMAAAQAALAASRWDEAEANAIAALKTEVNNDEANALLEKIQRQRRDTRYPTAMQAAQAAMAQGNYDEALKQVTEALKSRPDDPEAQKLQTDATLKRTYAAAMAAGKQALAEQRYDDAMLQADAALKLNPGDKDAADLKAQSLSQKAQAQQAQAQAQLHQQYDNQLQDLMKRFGARNKNGKAIDPSRSVLAEESHGVDPSVLAAAQTEVGKLREEYQSHAWLDDERTKCLDGVQKQIEKWSRVEPVATAPESSAPDEAGLADLKTASQDRLNAETEVLMVKFGIIAAKDAKSADARATVATSGQLELPEVQGYLKKVDALQGAFQAGGWITPEIKRNLDRIRKQITSLP